MKIGSIDNFRLNATDSVKKIDNTSFASRKERSDSNPPLRPLTGSFGASKEQKLYNQIIKTTDAGGSEQVNLAHKLARKYVIYKNPSIKTALVTADHYYLAYLRQLYKFAQEVKLGNKSIDSETRLTSPSNLMEETTPYVWKAENVDKVLECLKEEIKRKTKDLEQKSQKDAFVTSLEIDEKFLKDMNYVLKVALKAGQVSNISQLNINDAFFVGSMNAADNKEVKQFFHNMSLGVMTKEEKPDNISLSYYDELSKQVIGNLDKNYDTYVSYSKEDENAVKYFIDNLASNVKNGNVFDNCRNLKEDNTDITVFNEALNLKTMLKTVNKMGKDNKQHIIVLESFSKSLINSAVSYTPEGAPLYSAGQIESLFKHKPKNVHYVFIDNRDDYYNITNPQGGLEKEFIDFRSVQIPMMDSSSAKAQLLETKDYIEEQIGMEIEPEALEFACDVSATDSGSKYDNALKFLKNAASYYKLDSEVLKKEDIASYWQNTRKEDLGSKDASYNIIFDTKMGVDDIKGTPMVKQQARDIAYEIKNFPKTKGYILYNSTGEGGGRLHCAKAIAGEAKVPMVTINAADFAIRDLDTINSDPMEAIDLKISKLINLMKTQAQANPNKTVMLFISNFDRFGSNPLYGISSNYEQQAFKKLLEEMKKSQIDKSYNIVVMGSSDLPETVNENIRRPGLFMDDIIIYPPQTKKGVVEVALDHAKKNGYDFEGENGKEKTKVLKHFSTIMKGDNYVDMVDILDKANVVAKKQGRDKISIEDINEAYLTKLFGPTNEITADEKQKELVIRHEGGHALNLQFMYNLFKAQGDSIRIPDSIQNIALDPRGDFLGCVFHDASDENTMECNLETIFSRLVCAFGGNSAEQTFYDMNGSWGISQDRQNANYYAKAAVLHMGIGAHMGHYIPDIDPSTGTPILNSEDEANYSRDVKALLENAKILSDKIVECYSDFLVEFSDKNLDKFATGKCIITGPEFARSLREWEKRQPTQKKKEIYELKKEALRIVECTRDSKKYTGLNKINPLYRLS